MFALGPLGLSLLGSRVELESQSTHRRTPWRGTQAQVVCGSALYLSGTEPNLLFSLPMQR